HRDATEQATHYGVAQALMRSGRAAGGQRELDRLRATGIESPMIETLAARIKQAAADKAGASRILAEAQKRYPYSRAINYAYIAALQDTGANDAALAPLRESIVKYTKAVRLYGMQAEVYSALEMRV